MFRFLAFGVFLFVLAACRHTPVEQKQRLAHAVDIMEQYPDSALLILDSLVDPGKLTGADYHWYVVNHVRAKYKNYKDISADTLIFESADYFRKINDSEKLAYALFYSGCVLGEQGKTQNQMELFLSAESEANKTRNPFLKNLVITNIGNLYESNQNYQEALIYQRKAKSQLEEESPENYKRMVYTLNLLANAFLLNDKPDSAFYYYNEAISLGRQYVPELLSYVYQNMGVASIRANKMPEGKSYLRQAISMRNDSLFIAQLYNSLANVYIQSNELDSAKIILSIARNFMHSMKTPETVVSILNTAIEIAEKEEDYHKAYLSSKELMKQYYEIFDSHFEQNVLEVQKKYDLERKNEELLRMRKDRLNITIILLLIILLLTYIVHMSVSARLKEQKLQALEQEKLELERQQLLFLNQSFMQAVARSHAFEQEADSVLVKYDIKEQGAGYRELQKLFQLARKKNKMHLAAMANSFLDGKIPANLLESLTDGDKIYLALLKCNVPDMAALMKSNLNALRTRKNSIRTKFFELGLNPDPFFTGIEE